MNPRLSRILWAGFELACWAAIVAVGTLTLAGFFGLLDGTFTP